MTTHSGESTRRTQAERSATTIRKILDSSIGLLITSGYARTSTIEIAHAADISQGAVFRHFPTRIDLMTAVAEDQAAAVLRRLDAGLKESDPACEPLPVLLDQLERLCTDPLVFAWYELIDGSRSDERLAGAVIEVWQRLQDAIVDRAMKLPWPSGTERSTIDSVVFISMRVWEAEARFREVVGDSAAVLGSTRQRYTELISAIFEESLTAG